MVEFAIIVPVFALILVAVIDFGIVLYARMNIITLAREGANYGSQLPSTEWPNMVADVQGHVASAATTMGLNTTSPTLHVTVTCVAIQTTPPPCTWATNGVKSGDAVNVNVAYLSYPWPIGPIYFPILNFTLFGPINLGSTSQLVIYPPPAS